MNHGEDDSEFLPKVQQQTQKRDGIRTGRHRNPNSVACLQELVSPDVMEKTLCQYLHDFMVHPKLVRRWFSGRQGGELDCSSLGATSDLDIDIDDDQGYDRRRIAWYAWWVTKHLRLHRTQFFLQPSTISLD